MLELNLQIANDLNDILKALTETGKQHSDGFNISWFIKYRRPDLSESYCKYLVVLINYYNKKYARDWVSVDGLDLNPSFSTDYFFEQRGYVGLLEYEEREENIKHLTEDHLKKSIWQIDGWWLLLIADAVITYAVVFLLNTLK